MERVNILLQVTQSSASPAQSPGPLPPRPLLVRPQPPTTPNARAKSHAEAGSSGANGFHNSNDVAAATGNHANGSGGSSSARLGKPLQGQSRKRSRPQKHASDSHEVAGTTELVLPHCCAWQQCTVPLLLAACLSCSEAKFFRKPACPCGPSA